MATGEILWTDPVEYGNGAAFTGDAQYVVTNHDWTIVARAVPWTALPWWAESWRLAASLSLPIDRYQLLLVGDTVAQT